jgi:cell division protein FtsQ
MNAKTTIRKVLFVALWVCIGGGMFTLLLAAITKKKKGLCSDYAIVLRGTSGNYFLDKKDVQQLLMKATKSSIKGQPVALFNLSELEKTLENNAWINDAELYFDNKDVLHVKITEKEPVARIFTSAGSSFYIDSAGGKMPLSDKLSARVPVFTGFTATKILSVKDSLLLSQVRKMAGFISNDPFWMAQVAQIDITEEGIFEMTPVVGNHTVKLGNGEDIDKKFHRLMVFYKQVLSKTGFDKYRMIDVQYKGQVVVSKQAGDVKVDKEQLRKNVEKLLQQSLEAENDTIIKAMPVTGRYELDADSTINDFNRPDNNNDNRLTNPNPVKTISVPVSKPAEGKKQTVPKGNKPKTTDKKKEPKAVMPKKPPEETNGGYN